MNSIKEVDLSKAVMMYAISNTPIFLMKRLKEDPATLEISLSFSGEQIIAALRDQAKAEIGDSSDYVRPYVYLVALSQLPEIASLREARKIEGSDRWDWFGYIQKVLEETYSPLTITELSSSKVSLVPTISQKESQFSFANLEFSGRS